MNSAISVKDVVKRIDDRFTLAISDFSCDPGCCVGLLGPNGAGKTSLIRIMLGIYKPDSGTATVLGSSTCDREFRKILAQVGVVMDFPGLYSALTAWDNMSFYDRLFFPSATRRERSERIERSLASVGLLDRRHDAVRTFSKGMKQRLALARAFNHSPRILILDEPFQGLDVEASLQLCECISRVRGDGVSIVLSAHALNYMQGICDQYCIISNGKQVGAGTLSTLQEGMAGKLLLVPSDYIQSSDLIIRRGESETLVLCKSSDVGRSEFAINCCDMDLETLYLAHQK